MENCNVSALDNMFRTPLHWAAVLGQWYCPLWKMQQLQFIFIFSVFVSGHSKICGLLLESKSDFLSSDSNGATPLHYAAQNNFEV
jgi:inversin